MVCRFVYKHLPRLQRNLKSHLIKLKSQSFWIIHPFLNCYKMTNSTSKMASFHDLLLEKLAASNIHKPEEVKFVRILRNSPNFKRISIEFSYANSPGILIIEKSSFDENSAGRLVENLLEDAVLKPLKNLFRNDTYGAYHMELTDSSIVSDWNKVFVNIVHPARPKDIEKTLDMECFLVSETPELYERVTKPYIELQVKSGNLLWLYNVLEKKAEVDRIMFEKDIDTENGYLVTRDMKWKCDKPVKEMTAAEKHEIHLNALVMRRDLHSLRDLNQDHLPLLKSIQNDARKTIAEKLEIDPDTLRLYIHYQPSFYHLHVHFTHIKADAGGFQTERAHLLSQVISNIELMPDYYQRITLDFSISLASSLKREQFLSLKRKNECEE